MARKKVVEEIPNLSSLVEEYYTNNTLKLKYDKKVKELNPQIKELMLADNTLAVKTDKHNNRIFRTEDIEAEYYETASEGLDEEALIPFLKKHGYTDAIQTVEQIDPDKLEAMMYAGVIKPNHVQQMNKYKTVKYTGKLTVKAIKKGGK